MLAISRDSRNIQYIRNPSIDVQLEAIFCFGPAIQFIKHPCEQVQLEAINQNPNLILNINNPTEAIMRLSLENNNKLFGHIKLNKFSKAFQLEMKLMCI